MERKYGFVRLSTELTAKMLHLRDGFEVVGADFDFTTRTVRVFVQGEGLEGTHGEAICYPLYELQDRV